MHIFLYLRGPIDLGLFYHNDSKQGLTGYVYGNYLSNPYKVISQSGYIFMNGAITIS